MIYFFYHILIILDCGHLKPYLDICMDDSSDYFSNDKFYNVFRVAVRSVVLFSFSFTLTAPLALGSK